MDDVHDGADAPPSGSPGGDGNPNSGMEPNRSNNPGRRSSAARDNPGHDEYDVPDRPRRSRGPRVNRSNPGNPGFDNPGHYSDYDNPSHSSYGGYGNPGHQAPQPRSYPSYDYPPYASWPQYQFVPESARMPDWGEMAERMWEKLRWKLHEASENNPRSQAWPMPPWMYPRGSDNPGHGHGHQGAHGKENRTMDNNEKVSVNLGAGGFGPLAGGHGDGGGSNAALLALLAMGQNRDHGYHGFPYAGYCNDGGLGGGGIGALVLLAALGGGGLFGRDRGHCDGDGDHRGILFNQISQQLGAIQGSIPQAACETQNSILQQTNALQSTLATLGLAQQVGFANTGDKITNVGTAVLTAITNDGDKTRALIGSIDRDNLSRQLTVAQSALLEERLDRRGRDVEVNVTQQVNQQQQQQQFQVQFGDLLRRFDLLCGQIQNVRANQDIVNLGTMVASGAQTSTNTQVR